MEILRRSVAGCSVAVSLGSASLLLFAWTSFSQPVAAQPVVEIEPRVGSIHDEIQYRATGDEIPRFLVIHTFFKIGAFQVRDLPPEALHSWLSDLEIEAGSPAAEVMVEGLLAAQSLTERPTHDFSLEGEAYERFKERATQNLAGDLAKEFARLEASLAKVGYPPARLHRYIEEAIVPTMSFGSTEPTLSDLMVRAEQRFETRLSEERARLDLDGEGEIR